MQNVVRLPSVQQKLKKLVYILIEGGRNGILDPRNGNEKWRNLAGDELNWFESGTFMILIGKSLGP